MRNRGVCSVPECDSKTRTSGMCNAHYQRFWKYGDPLISKNENRGKLVEFYMNVVLSYEGNDCLIWPYGKTPKGYGKMTIDGKKVVVSRHLCEEVNGYPPAPDYEAAHSCGKGHLGCVTKGHLSWKTRLENAADRADHGTLVFGESSPSAKLTQEQVDSIIAMKGKRSQALIAREYGVHQCSISRIMNGKRWSHSESYSGA